MIIMVYSKEFKQNVKKYYLLLDIFKEEIGFDKFSNEEKLKFWDELCDYDYNKEENSCGNFDRLKEFIVLKLSEDRLYYFEIKLKTKERIKKEEERKINLLIWRIFNGQKR